MMTEAALLEADGQPDSPRGGVAAAAQGPMAPALGDAFRADEPGAFEQVVAIHEPRLSRLVYRMLGWREASRVEDIVQDVFLAALTHRRRFRGEAELGTWLAAIAVNRCRSHQRRQRLARWIRLLGQTNGDAEATWAAPASAERSAKVRAAVQSLPPRDREVIVLKYFESLSAAEIAAVTHQSANAVEVRLHRARARLAAALGPWHREESR